MLEDHFEEFTNNIYHYLNGKRKPAKNLIIKRHTENLNISGDFSFPNKLQSWHGHVANENVQCHDVSFMQSIHKSCDELVKASSSWPLKILSINESDRVHMFLERPISIRVGLSQALRNINLLTEKLSEECSVVHCDPLCEQAKDLTSLRLKYLVTAVRNLSIVMDSKNDVFVTCKSSSKSPEGHKLILCGTVLNSKSKVKETGICADEYIRIRQNEMTLIAQHKYGVRVSSSTKWADFLMHLGESAVIFELLQIKPSSPVKINFECSSGSSKGAAFILYNCARLETIIRTYGDKVKEGIYPELDPLESIDFSLLNQEEEWTIIFNYIMALPSLLVSAVDNTGESCEFRPHQVCSFLSSMVRIFSQYYRKTRILTEARKHLLPFIIARMHMLILLNDTLKICLRILNIKSVTQILFLGLAPRYF